MVSTINGQLNVYNVNNKERLWYYQTNGPISIPAAILDDKIVCADQDGKMYVFQPTSRNPTLRYQTLAPVSAAGFGAEPFCCRVRTSICMRWTYAMATRCGDIRLVRRSTALFR